MAGFQKTPPDGGAQTGRETAGRQMESQADQRKAERRQSAFSTRGYTGHMGAHRQGCRYLEWL